MNRIVRKQFSAGPAFVLAFFACILVQIANASTVTVGACSGATFTTIQSAINAVPARSVIQICPGTYAEQLAIPKPLTIAGIVSATADQVVIVPPAGGVVQNTVDVDSKIPIAAQILVQQPAVGVTIQNLTVDGSGNNISSCSPDLVGILFQNGSGTVNHVAVRNEVLSGSNSGCQSGQGIFVQTGFGEASSVTVENSSVHNYQKNGITGHDPNTYLNVLNNDVQGLGVVAVPGAAQNGIELAFGATGKVTGNLVIDNIYGDPTVAASCGILLYDTAENTSITVGTNTVGNTQIGIALITDDTLASQYGDGVTVNSNKVFGSSTYDAIDVCTNNNTVNSNTIMNSGEAAVHLDASCSGSGNNTGNGNTVSSNTILEAGCAGVLQDSGTTNSLGSQTYFTVPSTLLTGACPVSAAGRKPGKAIKVSPLAVQE